VKTWSFSANHQAVIDAVLQFKRTPLVVEHAAIQCSKHLADIYIYHFQFRTFTAASAIKVVNKEEANVIIKTGS
jgi:hypothetical protein